MVDGQDAHFNHLTIKDGLSHNSINDIVQDQDGNIWIATQNGLNKYNGYDLEVYKSSVDNTPFKGFLGTTITSLLVDRDQNLWVGTTNEGLNVKWANSNKFQNLNTDSAISNMDVEISSIYRDDRNLLWITTIGQGIIQYDFIDDKAKSFTSENSPLLTDVIFSLTEDDLGNIWATGADNNLIKISANSDLSIMDLSTLDQCSLSSYRKTIKHNDGNILLATDNRGLFDINIKAKICNKIELPSSQLRDIAIHEDQLWIASDGDGLFVYDFSSLDVKQFLINPSIDYSLSSNATQSLFFDRNDNLWIGTYNGGVNILFDDPPVVDRIELFGEPGDKVPLSSSILCMAYSDEHIVLGTDGDGLFMGSADQLNKVYPLLEREEQQAKSGLVITSLFFKEERLLWIGTYGNGLWQYDFDGQMFSKIEGIPGVEALSNNNIWDIKSDRQGSIYISTIGHGLYIYKPGIGFQSFLNVNHPEYRLSSDVIMTSIADSKGRIWIGTADNGLHLWEGITARHFSKKRKFDGLWNNSIRCIYEDDQSTVWVGTQGGGLFYYDESEKKFKSYLPEALVSSNIMAVLSGRDNSLWVTTTKGISYIDRDNDKISNFDFHTKQNFNQFNRGAAILIDDEKLLAGGIYGLHNIKDLSSVEDEDVNRLMFTDITISGKSLLGTADIQSINDLDHIALKAGDRSFEFSFSDFVYDAAQSSSFQYKLDPYNEEWISLPAGINHAAFQNVPWGNYTFYIKDDTHIASIDVCIERPFWLKWWFLLFLLFFMCSIIYTYRRFVSQRKQDEQKRLLVEAEKEILALKNKSLENSVIASNTKLLSSTAQMAHKNEVLTSVRQTLKEQLKSDKIDLYRIIRLLDLELANEDYWEEFNMYFESVDQEFIRKLNSNYRNLTQNDIRLCALLRLNLNTKEIASLLNISIRGVEKARSRLKKRMELTKEINLQSFIKSY